MALEEKLIMEVSNHKLLYDQSLPDFKDTESKNNIWATITRRLTDRDDPETSKYLSFLSHWDVMAKWNFSCHPGRERLNQNDSKLNKFVAVL